MRLVIFCNQIFCTFHASVHRANKGHRGLGIPVDLQTLKVYGQKTVRRFGWICSNSLDAAGCISLAAGAVTVTAVPTFG